jgi:hypothetical protein
VVIGTGDKVMWTVGGGDWGCHIGGRGVIVLGGDKVLEMWEGLMMISRSGAMVIMVCRSSDMVTKRLHSSD